MIDQDRLLLTHTSGHEYAFIHPNLMKWRASMGHDAFYGQTLEEKSSVPLVYEPGTSFSYGGSIDWAGKLVETLSGKTLDAFMKEKIWNPLGIEDMTFFPKEKPDMESRMAAMSTLNEQGEGPVTDVPGFDINFGATDCLGGSGAFGSAEGYFAFLQAVLKRDAKLLNDASWAELFKPQLNERCKKELNDYLTSSPQRTQWVGLSLPTDIVKQWSFAGMVVEQGQEGRMNEGTIFWGGMPSMTWVSSLLLTAMWRRVTNWRIVSRLQSGGLRCSVLPGHAANESDHPASARAVPEGNV
jgi:CubicO group peptidase (beta-lactamase class C family)